MANESSWTKATIAELASNEPYSTQIGPFGNKIKSKIYTSTGAPVLRGTQVNTASRYHDGDYVFVSEEYAENELSKFVCEADDIILCHKGTLGKIGIIPLEGSFQRYIMGNSMMKVRCNRRKVEPLYLFYWLCSHEGQHHIFSNVSQTGVPQIQRPLSTLREALVSLPSMAEQKSIAHILGTLDDKIELNRRMNETLESMARALFKSWFVDFDPVIDNALAAGNPIPEPLQARAETRRALGSQRKPLPENTQELFPDAFVFDEEMGWIPEGWEVGTVADVSHRVTKGDTPRKAAMASASDSERQVNMLRVNAITENGEFLKEKFLEIPESIHFGKSKRSILKKDYILYTNAGTIGRVAFVRNDILPANTNQAIAIIQPDETKIPPVFLYMVVRQPEFQLELHADIVEAVQANLALGKIAAAKFLMPAAAVLEAATKQLTTTLDGVSANEQKNSALDKLRDTLLPKLLSGELRVPEAMAAAEEALS